MTRALAFSVVACGTGASSFRLPPRWRPIPRPMLLLIQDRDGALSLIKASLRAQATEFDANEQHSHFRISRLAQCQLDIDQTGKRRFSANEHTSEAANDDRGGKLFPGLWFKEKSTRLYHRGEDNDAYANADGRGAGSSAGERLHSAAAVGNAGGGSVFQSGRHARHSYRVSSCRDKQKSVGLPAIRRGPVARAHLHANR
jgi:hypothetical protein